MEDSGMEYLMELMEGNPGAMSVIMSLVNVNPNLLMLLHADGIKGSEIWLLYKDICGEDIDEMIHMMAYDEAVDALKSVPYSKFYQEPEANIVVEGLE